MFWKHGIFLASNEGIPVWINGTDTVMVPGKLKLCFHREVVEEKSGTGCKVKLKCLNPIPQFFAYRSAVEKF